MKPIKFFLILKVTILFAVTFGSLALGFWSTWAKADYQTALNRAYETAIKQTGDSTAAIETPAIKQQAIPVSGGIKDPGIEQRALSVGDGIAQTLMDNLDSDGNVKVTTAQVAVLLTTEANKWGYNLEQTTFFVQTAAGEIAKRMEEIIKARKAHISQ